VPVLMHRLNNATQLLNGINAMIALRDAAHAPRTASDLGYASTTIDEIGWLLGVLSSASGHELLLARRERRGLDAMFNTVAEAARRRDRELAPSDVPLPDLRPHASDGWRLPWAFGAWLFANALVLPEKSRLEWRFVHGDCDEIVCRAPDHPERGELEACILERFPTARFRRAPATHSLCIASGALAWGS
jgi:hypothetical protein